ncbi:MAG: uracil-DNA glycosylase [Phycisphaeraceae bacterium]|nr:uracil-DNA glycosylase [Phycisphaeraceae bacterium]
MAAAYSLLQLNEQIVACTRCARLLGHCRKVAREKRAAYRDQTYWGKPVPNLLCRDRPRLLIVGLAPGAHGANRTGRMFTGDRSGDFLYRGLHEAGFASQAESVSRDDGLAMLGAVITAACHCAPPGNKPTAQELAHCAGHLSATFDAMLVSRKDKGSGVLPPEAKRVSSKVPAGAGVCVLTLGKIAHDAVLREYRARGWIWHLSEAPFGHGRVYFERVGQQGGPPPTLCCFHVSQQNTFTGRLTQAMLRTVLNRARQILGQA